MKTRFYMFAGFFIAAVFVFLCGSFIKKSASTYDENVHITAGYSYWKTGSIYLNMKDHPPLIKRIAAIPLMFMKLNFPAAHPSYQKNEQFGFADIFIYWNNVKTGLMVNSARFVIVFLGVILGLFVYLWARELFGGFAALMCVLLYALNPNIIAHTSLVTTDMGVSLGYFCSLYFLYKWIKNPVWIYSLALGISLGVAVMSKFSGVIIIPVLAGIAGYYIISKKFSPPYGSILKHAAFIAAGFGAVCVFSYGFKNMQLYFTGIERLFGLTGSGFSSFLLGEHSTTGWRHYFIAAFFFKNPEMLAIIAVFSGVLYLKKFISKKMLDDETVFLFLPAALFFMAASFSKFQIGIRHILPVFPLVIVWTGSFFSFVQKKKMFTLNAAVILLYALSALHCYPNFLSYFNFFAGGSANGYKYMVDSNYDWGQGLKGLGKYLNETGAANIYLSYFGTADPNYYGIKYIPVGFVSTLARQGNDIDISSEETVIFAISATNLQANYYQDKTIFEIFKSMKPLKVVDYTIFVYDITRELEANIYLRDLFRSLGDEKLEQMQERIIARIKENI